MTVLQEAGAAGYIGEPVSQLLHALQCAHFAEKSGGSDALIIAALCHDIGHMIAPPEAPQMAGLGVLDHEHLGAAFLRAHGFSEQVCELVRGHVAGKRYLSFKSEAYRANLSVASRGTLEFQGGPMTAEQAAAFEADPLFEEKVRLRRFDEAAKDTELVVAPLAAYTPMLQRHLAETAA